MVHLIAAKFHEHIIIGPLSGEQLLVDAAALKGLCLWDAEYIKDGRCQVDMGYGMGVSQSLSKAFYDQGDMGNLLVHGRAFLGQGMGVEHVPVVRGIDHNRVLCICVNGIQHPSDLMVHKGIAAQVVFEIHGKAGAGGGHIVIPCPQPVMLRLVFQGVKKIGLAVEFVVFIWLPEPPWAEEGAVGFIVGYHQEVVLVPVAVVFQEINGPVGTAVPIGEFLPDVVFFHALCLAGQVTLLRGQFIQVIAHIIPVIRIPAVSAAAKAKVVAAVQMPFTDIGCVDSVVREAASYVLHIVGEAHAVGPPCAGMGIASCKDGGAGRLAHGLGGVGLVKADAFPCQPVQVGGAHVPCPVAAQHIGALGICHDQNYFLVHIITFLLSVFV